MGESWREKGSDFEKGKKREDFRKGEGKGVGERARETSECVMIEREKKRERELKCWR